MESVRILVIDDEPDFLSLFQRVLGECNYEVVCIETGEEAIERLQFESFNLIILDMVLPDGKMTGIETLRGIRKINTDIFILITSAFATLPQAVKAIVQRGAQTYLRKPFSISELLKTVENGLKWRKQPTEIRSQNLKTLIELHEKSIMKRCFLTGSVYCPLNIEEDPKSVFVGMPFKDNRKFAFQEVYEKGIKPAVEKLGLSANRADTQIEDIVIMCKVCQGIQRSPYGIIDISDWNANVLFEFGLLLGLARHVILLRNETTPVPTDLLGFEHIPYTKNFARLKANIEKSLGKIIEKYDPGLK
ncbi:response regulator [candidate division KSB1 bacterium]|nr:response regulator [candidate division KSB1 bacterium]